MRIEDTVFNKDRNVHMVSYIQDVKGSEGEFWNLPYRPGIIVIPGGGYDYCSAREADPVATPYLAAGFDAFILYYSVKEHKAWPNPLQDYEQAMSYIKEHAAQWGLYPDHIAVIGFSAGGHLAGCAATMAQEELRPNACILGYPLTLVPDTAVYIKDPPSVVDAVTDRTCPMFVFAAADDGCVKIRNTTKLLDKLSDCGVKFESHIYAYGGHGFSTADTSIQAYDSPIADRATDWVDDSIHWLHDIWGDYGQQGFTGARY